MHKLTFLSVIFLVLSMYACKNDPFKVDTSGIDISLNIKRLDHDLFRVPKDNPQEYIDSLRTEYGQFFDLYNYQVVGLGDPELPTYPEHLNIFLKDFRIKEAKKKVREVFPDIQYIRKELKSAFKHYKYYFPEKNIPDIYTMISGFNQSIVTDTGFIGISLDKYLGSDFYFYGRLGWAEYKQQKMHKKKIPSDCMKAWALMHYPFNDSTQKANLLSRMIYRGSIIYYVKSMLPEDPVRRILGFKKKKMKWCRENEENMWAYFLDKELLFTSNEATYRKYLGDGPFTSTFTKKSPPRTGVWIGYRIIKKFMRETSDYTLKELMHTDDYQNILNKSAYSP